MFVNLYSGYNINPSKLKEWADENKAPEVVKWMDTKYWQIHNSLSRVLRYITIIENSSPGKNYYVFTTPRDHGSSELNKALDNVGINIVDRTIDTHWVRSMNQVTQQLKIPIYPRNHYAPLVHQVYHDKFVEKHFIA